MVKRSNSISQYKRLSRSTGRHFSRRVHVNARMLRRRRPSRLAEAVIRGPARDIAMRDYMRPDPPARSDELVVRKNLRTGSGVPRWNPVSTVQRVAAATREGLEAAANLAEDIREFVGNVAYDSARIANSVAPAIGAAYVGARAVSGNALPAARY